MSRRLAIALAIICPLVAVADEVDVDQHYLYRVVSARKNGQERISVGFRLENETGIVTALQGVVTGYITAYAIGGERTLICTL
jgi:hypothetical protein